MPAIRTRESSSSRTLEVSTDVSSMTTAFPTLSVLSPTPRAFTFPLDHNLNGDDDHSSLSSISPSPSVSPAFADYRPQQQTHLYVATASSSSVPPPLFRTLTPPPKPQTPSPGPSRHRRRRSSASSDVLERRPKRGDEDYIKRPENAFILFRRSATSNAPSSSTTGRRQRQADLSKTISQQWKSLSVEEKKHWEDLAKQKKKEHEEMYPNYTYRPERKKKSKKALLEAQEEEDRERSQSVDAPAPEPVSYEQKQAASMESATLPASDPAISFSVPLNTFSQDAQPYQQMEVPNVYSGRECADSACPPSMDDESSLLPLIARRSTYGGAGENSFDYIPQGYQQQVTPPSASFNDFAQGMFNEDPSKTNELGVHVPDHHFLGYQPQPSAASPTSSTDSSPQTGPYTPTSYDPYVATPSYSQQEGWANSSCADDGSYPQMQYGQNYGLESGVSEYDYDIRMGIQLQQEVDYSQFANFAWGGSEFEAQSQSQSSLQASAYEDGLGMGMGMGMGDGDFDLSAIPPIELGMPVQDNQLIYLPEQPEDVIRDEKGYVGYEGGSIGSSPEAMSTTSEDYLQTTQC